MSRNLRDSLLDILLDVQHGRATVYEAADRIEAVASTPSAEVSTDDIVEAVRPRVRCDRCGEAGRPIARISKGMALCGPCWQVTGGAPATEEAPGGAFDKALSEATEALGVRSRRGSRERNAVNLTNLKPLDGTVCCWSGCSEPIATGYLCAKHLAACKCRDGRVHFVGEGCDDNLNAEGICSVCASECSQDVGDAAVAQEEAK